MLAAMKPEANLFTKLNTQHQPLAEKMRPRSLEEVVGQAHLIGAGKPLSELIQHDHVPSLIFWGPPGTGKTTIARLIAKHTDALFYQLSAVLDGVAELRKIIQEIQHERSFGKRAILFVDEIHRWNKAQQDALLPHVENGTIIIIGSTTENPSFALVGALLSRAKVFVLHSLEAQDIAQLLQRALQDAERGLGDAHIQIDDVALTKLADYADGDARRALNALEMSAHVALSKPARPVHITESLIQEALQEKNLAYDKSGEEHYNTISAFIKSMRGSDPDAAVYYLARMLEAGEEPLFLARRMVIFASEDVSNADPQAVQVAIACMQSLDFVGMPEGWIPLAQCACYLASAPKSNASYMAYKFAKADLQKFGSLPVPAKLRNAPTKLMKELGYGEDYKYAHDYEGHVVAGEQYLPDKLQGKKYYEPTNNGYERFIAERLLKWKKTT